MTTLTQDEIILDTKRVMQDLEALKTEHSTILTDLSHALQELREEDTTLIKSKQEIVAQSLEQIQLGIEEAQIMMALSSHLQYVEGENLKLNAQVHSLCEENAWLRDELANTQLKMQNSEQKVAELEEQNKHLEFMNSIKTTEDNLTLFSQPAKDDTKNTQENLPDPAFGAENEESENHPTSSFRDRRHTLYNQLIQYASQGRYEIVEPQCKQALADLEKTSSHDHPDVAMLLNILGLVYHKQKKYKEAANLLNEALLIREKTQGDSHPAVAVTLNSLVRVYIKQGKYKEAEPLCKRALAIREKMLGPHHPDVAKQLNCLALLCTNQGKYDEVKEYYKRVLQIYNMRHEDTNVTKTKKNGLSDNLNSARLAKMNELFAQLNIKT